MQFVHPDYEPWDIDGLIFPGLRIIGKTLFDKYINELSKDIPLIDLGSGNGAIAKYLTDIGYNVITIDPLIIGSRTHAPPLDMIILKPKYNTVSQLIDNERNIVGNCNLLLNWCNPNDPNFNCYDLDAIYKLKPLNIILITELTGGANSTIFHIWLRTICENIRKTRLIDFLIREENIKLLLSIDKKYCMTKMNRFIGHLNRKDYNEEIQIAIAKIDNNNNQFSDEKYYVGAIC